MLTEILGKNFPIAALLDFPTPRLIEQEFILSSLPKSEAIANTVPFFLVHGKGGYTFLRPDFLSGLAKGRKMVVFELPGLRDHRDTPHRIEGIAKAYVAQLLAEYPRRAHFLSLILRWRLDRIGNGASTPRAWPTRSTHCLGGSGNAARNDFCVTKEKRIRLSGVSHSHQSQAVFPGA